MPTFPGNSQAEEDALTKSKLDVLPRSRGFWLFWALTFLCVLALADYFFALAGVEFIKGVIPVPQLKDGRGNALTAAGGMFAAFGAIFTFYLSFWQKDLHQLKREAADKEIANKTREQNQLHHEFDTIERKFSEISDDFAQTNALQRINAAIQLPNIALRKNPIYAIDETAREYPWVEDSVLLLCAAIRYYDDDAQLYEITKSLAYIIIKSRAIEATSPKPLVEYMGINSASELIVEITSHLQNTLSKRIGLLVIEYFKTLQYDERLKLTYPDDVLKFISENLNFIIDDEQLPILFKPLFEESIAPLHFKKLRDPSTLYMSSIRTKDEIVRELTLECYRMNAALKIPSLI